MKQYLSVNTCEQDSNNIGARSTQGIYTPKHIPERHFTIITPQRDHRETKKDTHQ